MFLVYALAGVLAFLALAFAVWAWPEAWESKKSTTPQMNNQPNPIPCNPKFGDTRIRVTTYGDGRKTYTPEVYDYHPYVPDLSWGSLWGSIFLQTFGTLIEAQKQIDIYVDTKKATTVISMEYITYP